MSKRVALGLTATAAVMATLAACQNLPFLQGPGQQETVAKSHTDGAAGAQGPQGEPGIAAPGTTGQNGVAGQGAVGQTGANGIVSNTGANAQGGPDGANPVGAANFEYGPARIAGIVRDEAGNPVAGATVIAGDQKTLTGPDGSYSMNVTSSPSLNVKVVANGFVLRDSNFPVLEGSNMSVAITMVPSDKTVSHIIASNGATIKSADGRAELIIPAGALSADADARVTWLDPHSDLTKPAAFKIQDVATADSAATDASITELNNTQLPGPLETKAYGNTRYFSPVAFASVGLSEQLTPGASATLRMQVSADVYNDMVASGDLKDSDVGQDIYPCFSWNADDSTWDKPALSKIEKDPDGTYWFVYTVRPTSMTVAPASYHGLAVGDEDGTAKVSLVVGGGRRVVDGTFTYSALIERSSNPAYDMHGVALVNGKTQGVTLEGGANWTNKGGNYRATNRVNLIRPNVATTNYTGTQYSTVMGADSFTAWDRNGVFQLGFAPGDKFEINPPSVFGVAPAPAVRSGTTSTAAHPYLPADLVGKANVTQTQTIPSTYVEPFYYYTDGKVTVNFTGKTPAAGTGSIVYTLNGHEASQSLNYAGSPIVIDKLARNAGGTPQTFLVEKLVVGDYGLSPGSNPSVQVAPGSNVSVSAQMMYLGAK